MQAYFFDPDDDDEDAHKYHSIYIQYPDIFYPSPPSTDAEPIIAAPEFIAEKAIEMFRKYANWRCIDTLMTYAVNRVWERPKDGVMIARALALVRNGMPDFDTLQVPMPETWTFDGGATEKPLHEAWDYSLYDRLNCGIMDAFWELRESDKVDLTHIVAPSNYRLTTTLLSVTAIKFGLQEEPNYVWIAVSQGLENPEEPNMLHFPEMREVMLVIACFYLVTIGQKLREWYDDIIPTDEGIQEALKLAKESEVLTLPSAVNLLEKAIDNVRCGYLRPISEMEAWETLFPPSGLGA
ncbi:hypothetical protein BJ912DRAFT_256304 [Pholiota molesta]|nr:hypothetical protein BJ912DRAFT_256304 [Pholiota molesta]